MTRPTIPAMRYHGGKFRLADWIISHFPRHTTYCEPFGGAASVLLAKPRSDFEVYNDLDDEIVNVFRVMRQFPHSLREAIRLTPYSRAEFLAAFGPQANDPVERARRTIIRAQQGFGSAGATKGRTGFRSYSGGAGRAPNPAASWATYADHVEVFAKRLTGVLIESVTACRVMEIHDGPDTLHYIDPPYLPETRTPGRYYRHEMTIEQHAELLETINSLQGMVLISGYPSALYNEALSGWTYRERPAVASGRYGSVGRTEGLWISPRAEAEAQAGIGLFSEATA